MAKKRGPYRVKRLDEPPKQRSLIKVAEWRTYRGWTIEELAERSGLSVGTISDMASGEAGFSKVSLRALAKALGCTVGELFDVDPTEATGLWKIWSQMSPEERQTAVRVLEAMRRG